MRLFIALDLPKAVKIYIKKVQSQLKAKRLIEGVFTTEENLHITLLFIGDVSDEACTRIISLLSEFSVPTKWDILLMGLEYNCQPPTVLWLRLFSPILVELHEQLRKDVFGNLVAERPFIPHCTLVRIQDVHEKSLMRFLQHEKVPEWSFAPQTLALKRSDTLADGVRYTDIFKRVLT